VTNALLDVLNIFYGDAATRANILSGNPDTYALQNGMTLNVLLDQSTTPLLITFLSSQFTNIEIAKAHEVAEAISLQAYNAGYNLFADVYTDPTTQQTYVQLFSGTLGSRSAITVLGGSAQNVLRFPSNSASIAQGGNTISFSFVGEYVRFTFSWGSSANNPNIGFLNVGDTVNIYGSQFDATNQGYYKIENLQDGPSGSAYIDIINPNFTQQPLGVTLLYANAVSGGGSIRATSTITATGLVRSSNIVTVTTSAAHGFVTGDTVTVQNTDNSGFSGIFTIISTPTSTTFTYNQDGVNITSGDGTAYVDFPLLSIPSGAVRSGGVTTLTVNGTHNLYAGQNIQVIGVSDSSFDGAFQIATSSSPSITITTPFTNDLVFYSLEKNTLTSLGRYASIYQVNPYEIVVYMPVTTAATVRGLLGAWHIHASTTEVDWVSGYAFSPYSGLICSKQQTALEQNISIGSSFTVLNTGNLSSWPNTEKYFVINYGYANQEGPIKYFEQASNSSLLIDPSYRFQQNHAIGETISLLQGTTPYAPNPNGTDYPTYITDSLAAYQQAFSILESITAAGITLSLVLILPETPGLQDVSEVYGPFPTNINITEVQG
jgi:hypothetical protein